MKSYLSSSIKQFQYYRHLGLATMEQLEEQDLFYEPAPLVNSISVMVKHLHGNMMSRWTDFLTSDGEKEWRARDGEFEETLKSREDIYTKWNEGWDTLMKAIEPLTSDDLEHIVYIRNQGHTVMEAIQRQLCHYSYHVGQMVYLGKIIREDEWDSLSIPRGESGAYNRDKFTLKRQKRHFTDHHDN